MFNSSSEFYAAACPLMHQLHAFTASYDLIHARVDHLCYKAASRASYESLRGVLEQDCEWLYQSFISGRRISVIRTRQGIETLLGRINLVELSDQKSDGSQREGFDHIELYLSSRYDETIADLKTGGVALNEVRRPHHTTHDVRLSGGLLLRFTREALADKIRKEMR